MLTETDRRLRAWMSEETGVAVVDDSSDATAIVLEPIGFRPDEQKRSARGRFDRLQIRYRLSVSGPPSDALTVFERVFDAIGTRGDVQVHFEPLDTLGILIDVDVEPARQEPDAPRVLVPLVMDAVPMSPLTGTVVAEGRPAVGAIVRHRGLRRETRTGTDGRFTFSGAPATGLHELAIVHKGDHYETTTEGGEPVVVTLETKENA